ncbi:hypothetical protein F4813DRAFT_369833 [Daldinia decipiens]|uniref:uncharacterized protein n=1 Tax=Daldinia decipiens TaxID=326647 RepID=UPI0020C39128|nr:uncharacterized protein F4813DRAFT_369833 [Daldinia decipiens]KAI1654672.1 hypothetical protein F4813DRAFT_369833 [Daldinia decipiens]
MNCMIRAKRVENHDPPPGGPCPRSFYLFFLFKQCGLDHAKARVLPPRYPLFNHPAFTFPDQSIRPSLILATF